MESAILIYSNKDKTEFGMRLSPSGPLLAATNCNTSYVCVIEQLPYLNDLQYDWIFVLRHWLHKNGYQKCVKNVVLLEKEKNDSNKNND